jgi:hypothetical protein
MATQREKPQENQRRDMTEWEKRNYGGAGDLRPVDPPPPPPAQDQQQQQGKK